MNRKLLLTLSAIGCMSLALGVGCTNASNDIGNPTSQLSQVEDDEESSKECKIKNTKEYDIAKYVKDGDYATSKVKDKSYKLKFRHEKCTIEDIVLPKLNMESESANRINEELKEIYAVLEKGFLSFLEGEDSSDGYVKSDYKAYINGDILSVVIKMDYIYDEMPVTPCNYYTFNISLETEERVQFEELCELAGIEKDNINSSVIAALMADDASSYIPKEDIELGDDEPWAVTKYKNEIKANNVMGYVNEDGYVSIVEEVVSKKDVAITYAEIPVKTMVEEKGLKKSEVNKYVEDAYYVSDDMKDKFYIDYYDKSLYDYKSMRLPKIKLDSKDAKKANKEIKKFQDIMEMQFKTILNDEEKSYGIVSRYSVAIEKGILSVALRLNDGMSGMPNGYKNYNFDIKSGKLLSFKEVVKKLGKDMDDVDKAYEKQLEKFYDNLDEDAYAVNKEKEIKAFVKEEMEEYEKSKKDNKVMYFIDDEDSKLTVNFEIATPDGLEDYQEYYEIKF